MVADPARRAGEAGGAFTLLCVRLRGFIVLAEVRTREGTECHWERDVSEKNQTACGEKSFS